MSVPEYNDFSTSLQVSSDSSLETCHNLRLYYVRIHDVKEQLKIAAIFDGKIKLAFNNTQAIYNHDGVGPVIYTLDLIVIVKNNEQLYVNYKGRRRPINECRLCCSYTTVIRTDVTCEEKRDIGYSLREYLDNQCLFLFDVHFSSSYGFCVPGQDTELYTDLCLFTYFILTKENYYLFNALAQQFQRTLLSDDYNFNKYNFDNFFEYCFIYLSDIPINLSNDQMIIRLITILRMIGLLAPINKNSFDRDCLSANAFTKIIMGYVRAMFMDLLARVDSTEQLLFKSGLAILTSFYLLYQQKDDLNEKKLAFILQISDEKERQDIANEILFQLSQLEQPILGNSNWTDLFTIVDPEKININHLDLIGSFETLVLSIIKISKVMKTYDQFKDNIDTWLHNRVSHNFLKVDLPSLLYLLKFLRQNMFDDQTVSNPILLAARLAILCNNVLKWQIKFFFDKSEINMKNIEDISIIFSSINDFPIFEYIDKYKYLKKSLSNDFSEDYYIMWFQYFLANNQIRNNHEIDKSKNLLESWLNCLRNNYTILTNVLNSIDKLLNTFDQSNDNDWFYLYFIDRVINLCFEQDSILSLINNGLYSVQNKTFRLKFQKIFDQEYLNKKPKELFKSMHSQENPLYKLIILDKRKNSQSLLIRELMELICNKTEITTDELMNDAFNQPKTSTFTHKILFENSFRTLSIHRKIIERLIIILEEWKENGFHDTQIAMWKEFSDEKRKMISTIWNFIGKNLDKPILFEQLIDKTIRKYEIFCQIREDVTQCINTYCQNACDKNHYLNILQHIQNQLNQKNISSIKIPKDIEALENFAERLNSISKYQLWQKHLKQHLSDVNCKFINAIEPSRESDFYLIDSSDGQPLTCLIILKRIDTILNSFIIYISNLLNDKTRSFLSLLDQIFSDKHRINYEFNILKVFLDPNIVSYLEVLLDYWKNHENIKHICKGYLHLYERYSISDPDKLLVIQNVLNINESTSGERFLMIYNDFEKNLAKNYSESLLNFIIQWSSSNKVIEFLYSLLATDVDNLLEVVNDWDETFDNAAMILDFVVLKSFLDQFDTCIKSIQTQKLLEFKDIIDWFERLHSKKEFIDIINVFKQCSQSLSTIQHIHTVSTNREQSKQKHILDIMQAADIGFCVRLSKQNVFYENDCEFDVCVTDKKNLKTMYFIDLSELRDRARLIEYSNTSSNQIQTYTDSDIQQLRLFISFIETIEIILNTLTALHIAGYPFLSQFLWPEKKFLCYEGKYPELKEFSLSLNQQFDDWDKQLCTMYKECIDLTYFSYQQIWMLEKSLYKQSAINSDDIGYHLLKFIGINPQSISSEILPPLSDEVYGRLKNMAQILNSQHIQEITSVQKDVSNNKEILVISTSYKGILRGILSLFNRYNIPINTNQLFYCTKHTTWIEVRAFIYRCIYSETLHQLIQPELLSLLIQEQVSHLFDQFIEQNPTAPFRLGIITTISTSRLRIIDSLRFDHIVQTIPDPELLNRIDLENGIQKLIGNNCKLVTSRIAGLGKSTYIRNEIHRLGKEQIRFPISGDMDIDTLMQRLRNKKIQSTASPIAIHIDLGPVENVQQLNEFLYCLILFRCFRLGQMPVFIAPDIPIYIELDSSSHLSNITNEIILFEYLQKKNIDRMNWNELEVNNPIHIQLITDYFQAIENETINKENIYEKQITQIDKQLCIQLLQKYFIPKKNPDFTSWTQLSIFIAVYYRLFSSFSNCGYFMTNDEMRISLRSDILKSLLNSSDQFTSLSVEKVRQNQRAFYDNGTFIPFSEAIVRWDKLQPFTIIFTATYDPIFIYKTKTNVPLSVIDAFLNYFKIINRIDLNKNRSQRSFSSFLHRIFTTNNNDQMTSSIKNPKQYIEEYFINPDQMTHEQFFFRLTSLSPKYLTRTSICPKCFRRYDHQEKQCHDCSTSATLIRLISTNEEDIIEFKKKIAEKIHSEYVFTADNYIKMLLIYLRIQSNIPVLIMGETGCGKTSLIQCLCQKILDDKLEVFPIHAGVTNEKIIEKMHEYCTKAETLLSTNENKRLWIFLDEFNTTPNIGLLKEFVCDRTFLGEPLPSNMVFLGACNPQRCKKNGKESLDKTDINNYYSKTHYEMTPISSTLLYSVVPIPETMLEYVWDYGYLDQSTERTYIKTILNRCEQLIINEIWFERMVNLISKSQQFFREYDDVSSVSLRDVVRFCTFYNWFYNIAVPSGNNNVLVTDEWKRERASLLALFLCYYFRIDSSKDRKYYMTIIATSIQKFRSDITLDALDQFLQNEKMAIVDRMELPAGTAKNRALTDNIFVLFTCIFNRIPVILCGKPGSSKTSAVQILISNLRGQASQDLFFQTLPKLIPISYQGSYNCTSESIIKVFTQAHKSVQTTDGDSKLLPVIVIDEIGLAELSPHNPLKVLHAELETETCRYGFVGLSNWRLDASKMNRAVYLSCPDPDIEDLKIIAKSLARSIEFDQQTIPLDDAIIEALAVSYMSMGQHLKQYYFGLRDYYSLIKAIVYDLVHKKNEQQDLYKLIHDHLCFNFDGIVDGSKFLWSKFCEYTQQVHRIDRYSFLTFDRLLNHSLSSRTGRFLMLIGENENAFDYVQQYINKKYSSIKTRTLIGSTFSGDLLSNTIYTEQYNNRILMDVILYAEKDLILFLRGLDHLYDNLYDLFNQSFAVLAQKKYCRIALGTLYHPRCFIHENFYCIVFLKRQDMNKYDEAFLNRFEKHLIDMEALIDERYQTVMSALIEWVDQVLSVKSNTMFSSSKYLFNFMNKDYLLNLVTDTFNSMKNPNDEAVIEYCKEQILRVSSFDLPLVLSLNSKQDHHRYLIERYYKIHTNSSFSAFINQKFKQEKLSKLLIYTYTQIHDTIDYSDITDYQQWIEEVKLSHFRTELELIQKLKLFHQIGSSHLLCIRIDYHQDNEHLAMLKQQLLNMLLVDENHGICLIFHLQRNKLHQLNNSVYFNEWSSIMIDDLQKHQIIPKTILLNPSYIGLIDHLNVLSSESTCDALINRYIIKSYCVIPNENSASQINERRDRIIQQLSVKTTKINNNCPSLRFVLKDNIFKMIKNIIFDPNQCQYKDWREDLLTNEIIIGSSHSFNDALSKTISFFLDEYFSLLLSYLEKNIMIDSYLFLLRSDTPIRENLCMIWFDCLTRLIEKAKMSIIKQNYIEIPLIYDLHLPCATIEYDIIRQIRQLIAQDRRDNNEILINYAYRQLISKSIYGQFIHRIFDDSDLFAHYYHDQLTLTRNEAGIHQISTSFLQSLLIGKIPGNIHDRLKYLLIDYEELFEIMRVFQISVPLIGNEDTVLQILNEQFIFEFDKQETITGNNSHLYRLVIIESNYHLIPPGCLYVDEEIFKCQGNPFIEVSLMNVLELLISPEIINCIKSMEQLTGVYGRVIQDMTILGYFGHYAISNLEKIHSFVRLASCISRLFSHNKAMNVFKQIYNNSNYCIVFDTLDQIHGFINYLDKLIHEQESIVNDVIKQTLLKLEGELLRNWFLGHFDQCDATLKFINDRDQNLWKYSAKIFTTVVKKFNLLPKIKESNDNDTSHHEEHEKMNQCLCQLNDPTRKIEVLMTMRIYMAFTFDKDYESLIKKNSPKELLITKLTSEFARFEENMGKIDQKINDHTLEMISSIAWLRYYLLYYVLALKRNISHEIIETINDLFVRNSSGLYSTVKLYIIKQLCYIDDMTFHDLCHTYKNRNVTWINSIITRPVSQQVLNARYNIILPTPLFECEKEFKVLTEKLTQHITDKQWKAIIRECSTKQETSYCLLMWFIQYYTRFYVNNLLPDDEFVKLIEQDIHKELNTCFEDIGYKLIYSLCKNFDKNSYFHLNPSMSEEHVHQRLLVLNIIALIISFKSSRSVTLFSFLLFNSNLEMPQKYGKHFEQFDYLTGVTVANDPVLIQMITIQDCINKQAQSEIRIFRCSSDCFWLFYSTNNKMLEEHNHCPLCEKKINIDRNEDPFIINEPHIQMNTDETLLFINKFTEQYKKGVCLDTFEKRAHLNLPVTHHFINFLTHAIFLFLNEVNCIPSFTTVTNVYYREQIDIYYNLIRKSLSNVDQCYLWFYKMINHLMNKNFLIRGYLNSPEKVMQLEKLIEEKLIIPHAVSVVSEIRGYKLHYADYTYANNKQNEYVNFVEELIENEERYPLLNFFNIINIDSINIIDDFYNKLQLLSNSAKIYPLTTFILKRLSDYDNIQYLSSMIKFATYLMQKFNYCIERNDAKKTTIADCLRDDKHMTEIAEKFREIWYKINLNEVYLNGKKYLFKHSQSEDNFESKTNISMFLLNKSNDNESILLTACLQTIANLQNEIVDYFHSNCLIDKGREEKRIVPIQTLHQTHLFNLDTNKIRELLLEKCLMVNYTYGMSKEIIYNFDEIEWTLRYEISCLPKIDTDNIRQFTYQSELYDENMSLITVIRQRFQQTLFDDTERKKIQNQINSLTNEPIIRLFDSLKYILIYLRTINNRNLFQTLTLEMFVNEYMHLNVGVDKTIIEEALLSSINLQYIIDLYELIEESIFEKIFRKNIRNELSKQSFSDKQRMPIIGQMIQIIQNNENLADCFKDSLCWISMLKRLLVRLLSSKMTINFDLSFNDYVKRTDMWKGNITKENIQTIEIDESIHLKHAFIILDGLEEKQKKKTPSQSLINSDFDSQNNRTSTQRMTSTLSSRNVTRSAASYR